MRSVNDINYMDPQEFLDLGLLHEINRLLLHPIGLALQVTPVANEGGQFSAGVWDYRDDREGIYYDGGLPDAEKAVKVAELMFERREGRKEELGYVIQPVDSGTRPTLTTTYVDPKERQRG